MTEQAIKFCCEEVARQYAYNLREGCFAVPGMIDAWCESLYDREKEIELTEHNLKYYAEQIEPIKNKDGYRRVGVRVGTSIKCSPDEVPRRMKRFFKMLPNMTPEEAYLAFEEIHPFVDGNGRVGKILFFYLRNEMETPSHDVVPNPWGIANP